MIGSEAYTVSRPNKYLYSGVGGANKIISVQPPTDGCFLRIEGTGTVGIITITGTATDASTTETISSFDTDKVGFSVKKWTALTKFTSTSFTSLIIYPSTESGEKLQLSSSSTFQFLCDTYETNLNQFRGKYFEYGGVTIKDYKGVLYDDRYTLQEDDQITINGKTYTVALVSKQHHGLNSALLIIWR